MNPLFIKLGIAGAVFVGTMFVSKYLTGRKKEEVKPAETKTADMPSVAPREVHNHYYEGDKKRGKKKKEPEPQPPEPQPEPPEPENDDG